jgi:predicted O-methyltransferase YrrM
MTLAHLQGLITPDVGEALGALAATVPAAEAIVEIGSYKGMSTAHLAVGSRDGNGARVYAVDPWDLPGNEFGKHGYSAPIVREEFERQLRDARVWGRVTPIRGFSVSVAKEWAGPQVGLLFIDADHREKSVRADAHAWAEHLASGHVIAFDDLDTPRNPGVRVVVEEFVAAGYTLEVHAERLAVLRVA